MTRGKGILIYGTAVVVGAYFLFLALIEGKPFLAPFVTAVILSLVILPLTQKMEKGKIGRSWASILSALIIFLLSLGFVALISFQLKSFVNDWPKIKETMKPKIEQLRSFVVNNSPLNESDLQISGESSKSSSSASSSSSSSSSSSVAPQSGKKAVGYIGKVISFLGNYLLTFIYIFFLLSYRRKFKKFLLRLFPDEKREKVKEVIVKSAKVAPQYLWGRLLLIAFLAVLYSVGLGISGVNNFILISLIAAILSLIPYIGNIVGLAMAMAFGYLTSGDPMILIGIIITFSVAQFVESYVLEPYVVGDKVDIHPFVVILVVVIGNLLWGVIGMVIAIPVMAIITVVMLHIPELRPYGILFSKEKFSE